MALFDECIANFCMFCVFNLHFLFSFVMPISARSHCSRTTLHYTNVDEACGSFKGKLKTVVFRRNGVYLHNRLNTAEWSPLTLIVLMWRIG